MGCGCVALSGVVGSLSVKGRVGVGEGEDSEGCGELSILRSGEGFVTVGSMTGTGAIVGGWKNAAVVGELLVGRCGAEANLVVTSLW